MITDAQQKAIDIWIKDFWTDHDPEAPTRCFTEDIVYRDVAVGFIYNGQEEMRQYLYLCTRVIPDFAMKQLNAFNVGRDVVAVTWEYWGHFVFGSINKYFKLPGQSVLTFRGDRIATCYDYYDGQDWVDDIGMGQYTLQEFDAMAEAAAARKRAKQIAQTEIDLEAHFDARAPKVDSPMAV